MLLLYLALAALTSLVAGAATSTSEGWETRYTATKPEDVARAAATAKTTSPTSKVKGKAFDRFVTIWFENQNFEKCTGDPNFGWIAQQGITLTNLFAVTHPSQPNYMASIAGDYFGMNHDRFLRSPRNISTVLDLLDSKKISWSLYQEDMPFSGYEGKHYVNQDYGANDYVRKHNPAIMHDSVTYSEQRLSQVKNLSMTYPSSSMFHHDLHNDKLPQWMFITPNMSSDGHDTSVTTAGEWCRRFVQPLLNDPYFMKNTMILITWDENETYARRNNIMGILVGDAVPPELVGTSDNNFYNHYSSIATVSANWDLPTLGRWDVGANVFAWVANMTGDQVRSWPSEADLDDMYWNHSYGGPFHRRVNHHGVPAPNLKLDQSSSGRRILKSVRDMWKDSNAPTYYEDSLHVPDGRKPPEGFAPR
ncbi:hypothetical protein CDD82_888 [Ophiocordyceps australis]|uniref:Acid phosphatase n=1 Tax=Ophiocordyceps australis TaxID=1399860 RepID=A0A2C5YEV9_9HYPO|nr:hypothetical protein CDD82_888 [Ophiocordyceps australis]